MKVALIQMNSGSDKAANVAAARDPPMKSKTSGRQIQSGRSSRTARSIRSRADKLAAAEEAGRGPAWTMLRDMAKTHGVFIHGGSILERIAGEERVGNTTFVFNRAGAEIARYRKIHMFDITAPDGRQYNESASMKPGDAVATYDCEGVTIGCSICYDLRFPDLFQALMAKGAQVIALPAAFTLQTGKDHWEVLLRARAIETQTYVCAAGQTGLHMQGGEPRATWGHSMVIDPWGHVTARASDGVGYVAARIDPARVANVRAMIPVARHKVKLT